MTGGKLNGAIRGFLNLLRDRGGNVLPMAAIGMLLTAALVGGGIDMSRAYRVNNRLFRLLGHERSESHRLAVDL